MGPWKRQLENSKRPCPVNFCSSHVNLAVGIEAELKKCRVVGKGINRMCDQSFAEVKEMCVFIYLFIIITIIIVTMRGTAVVLDLELVELEFYIRSSIA